MKLLLQNTKENLLFFLTLVLPLLIIKVVVRSFVFMKLFNWFIAGTILNSTISFLGAFGILLIIGLFDVKNINNKKDLEVDSESVTNAVILYAVFPFIILLIGWLVSFYV